MLGGLLFCEEALPTRFTLDHLVSKAQRHFLLATFGNAIVIVRIMVKVNNVTPFKREGDNEFGPSAGILGGIRHVRKL